MARPRKTDSPDLDRAHDLTIGAIERLSCPPGREQAFLRDASSPGLRVRVTKAGAKSFVFEAKLNRQTIRRTIGDVRAWTIEAARKEANRLRVTLDAGDDPRELDRQKLAAIEAKRLADVEQVAAEKLAGVTVGEVWAAYLADRRPFWGERHYADHLKMAKAGGEVAKRGVKPNPDGSKPLTVAGPVHRLLAVPLRDLTPAMLEAWATEEAKLRPTWARLCWRCLKVFLNWCAEHPEYSRLLVTANPAKTKRTREALGKPQVKDDALQREQLAAWFAAVRQIQNPVIAAYLQVMLLTGARPGEVLTLKWEDVNTQWKGLTIRDKVEGERVIPLTPYVAHLLAGLPRRNGWVFSSTRALAMDEANTRRRARNHAAAGTDAPEGDVAQASASGHLTDPSSAHRCACATAGLEGLTLHGLRRSFASLTEWLEVPTGVVAQIQGHKPSATAEKHYKRRPLDLLRVHHETIEAWVLEQAGIEFTAAKGTAARALSLV
jgi:integrase